MWLVFALFACSASRYIDCTPELTGCYAVDGGRYLAVEPADTSGPMPTMIYFHGYSSNASNQLGKSWLDDVMAPGGWLTIFPDGVNETWSHDGSPHSDRDEIAFLDAVLDDVAGRWEVAGFYGSGFSQGGSMAWYAACERGQRFAAFFPASGSFWEPLPEACPGGPVHLRHTHGTADATVPMEGRPIGLSHQGDTWEGMALWRSENGCSEAPDREVVQGELTCQIWESCSSGRELQLCLHDGGHSAPGDWMAWNAEWALGLAR